MDGVNSVRIRFLGAAGTVTGSKYLLTANHEKILIDCGLFQGLKEHRLKNWDRFPVDPKDIKALILTHAHVDHSGYIPKLIKEGFTGKIYCTSATLELCRILLPDTGYLQEEDARWLNKKKLSKHEPALPLFTKEEADQSLNHFISQPFHQELKINDTFKVTFRPVGHILGAASVVVEACGKRIVFTGDVGRLQDPVMKPPENLPKADYLVIESTYGDRLHPQTDEFAELQEIVNSTVANKGVVLIPAFAVGRAQSLMHILSELMDQNRIPKVPIYLNSPMATNATKIFCDFLDTHKLSSEQCQAFNEKVTFVKTPDESKALNEKKGPMIIISASGMATGGRILHHLKAFGANPKNTIVLAGFQAMGTRGRALQEGSREMKYHGQIYPINAKVAMLENVSAHADYAEMMTWLERSEIQPRQVFITHGEASSAFTFKKHLENKFHWSCFVPMQDQEFSL